MYMVPCNTSPSVTDRQFPEGNSNLTGSVPLLATTNISPLPDSPLKKESK
jgi:hypothetical protein